MRSLLNLSLSVLATFSQAILAATGDGSVAIPAEPLVVRFSGPPSRIVNVANQAFLRLSGTCSKPGGQIAIAGVSGLSSQAVCQADGTWSIENFSVVNQPDGAFVLTATDANLPGGTPASIELVKNTETPVLILQAPANHSAITSENHRSLAFSGRCGEVGQNVNVTLSVASGLSPRTISAAVKCPMSHFFAINIDTSALPDSADILASVTHGNAAGNTAVQDVTLFKDAAPVVATITSLPPAVNLDNVAAIFLRGTCSKSGHPVYVDIAGPDGMVHQTLQTLCLSGTWMIPNASIFTLPDGMAQFQVTHVQMTTSAVGQSSLTVLKDVVRPVVAIAQPKKDFQMNAATGTKLTVHGTCTEEGQPVLLGPNAIAQAKCVGGLYSIVHDYKASPDGDIKFEVLQKDRAGNMGVQSLTIHKDVNPARLTFDSPAEGSYINASSSPEMVFAGTCSEFGANGQQVDLSGSVSGTASCDQGRWSMKASVTQAPDGAFVVKARHKDLAGNPVEVIRTLKKDVSVPVIRITYPSVAPGAKFRINASNASLVLFEGTCIEEGASITLSGAASGAATCIKFGWSIKTSFVGAANNADLKLTFTIRDPAGNSASQDFIVFKDTIVPKLTITKPSIDGYVINASHAANVVFAGTCSETGQSLESGSYYQPVVLSGAVTAIALCQPDGTWSIMVSMTTLPEGNGQVTFTHKDMAGNAASVARTFRKKTTPPVLTFETPADKSKINLANYRRVSFSGACSEVGQPVTLSGAVGATVLCSAQKRWIVGADLSALGVRDGDLKFSVKHQDDAMNSVQQDVIVFKDTVAPTLSWLTPAEGYSTASGQSNLTLSGLCSEAGQPVLIAIGTSKSLVANCMGSKWAAMVDFAGLPAGPHAMTATHSDLAGNPVSATRTMMNAVNEPGCDHMIVKAEDFANIKPMGGVYCLKNDIVFPSTTLPSYSLARATLDGRGKKLIGMRTQSSGLFKKVAEAKIKNLVLDNPDFGASTNGQPAVLNPQLPNLGYTNLELEQLMRRLQLAQQLAEQSSPVGLLAGAVSYSEIEGVSLINPPAEVNYPKDRKGSCGVLFGTLEESSVKKIDLRFVSVSIPNTCAGGGIVAGSMDGRWGYLSVLSDVNIVATSIKVAAAGVSGGIIGAGVFQHQPTFYENGDSRAWFYIGRLSISASSLSVSSASRSGGAFGGMILHIPDGKIERVSVIAGDLRVEGSNEAGGIIGSLHASNLDRSSISAATARVDAQNGYPGGIVGSFQPSGMSRTWVSSLTNSSLNAGSLSLRGQATSALVGVASYDSYAKGIVRNVSLSLSRLSVEGTWGFSHRFHPHFGNLAPVDNSILPPTSLSGSVDYSESK